MAFDTAQDLTSSQDAQREAAAKRLKSAQRAMITSAIFTVLLLAVVILSFVNGRNADAANHEQTSIFGAVTAVILLRVAYRGWRLYSTWKNLKDAQQAHRSLQ